MKAAFCLILAATALSACGKPEQPHKKLSTAEATAIADRKLASIPEPREYSINGHHLIVLQIPVRGFGDAVDYQRCFVWRDMQFQSASMQCEQPPEIDFRDLER